MAECAVLRCPQPAATAFVPERSQHSLPWEHVEVPVCDDHGQRLAEGADWAWNPDGGLLMDADRVATGEYIVRSCAVTRTLARQDRDGRQVFLNLEAHRRGADQRSAERLTLVLDEKMLGQLATVLTRTQLRPHDADGPE